MRVYYAQFSAQDVDFSRANIYVDKIAIDLIWKFQLIYVN